MSRETDAMQFVLDLLTDGILTSTTRQIGFTNPDKVPETDLPFVQAYAATAENQDQEERQPGSVLTFNVDIIDVFDQREKLADAITALDEALRIDKSFTGTQEKGFVSLRALAQRQVNERSVAGCVIEVRLSEGFPDPSFTSLFSFADSSLFTALAGSILEDSQYIAGMTGLQKVGTGTPLGMTISGAAGFPLDLTVTNRLRVLSYVNPEYADTMTSQTIRIESSGSDFNNYTTTAIGVHGWSFPSYSLADPQNETGVLDLSAVTLIRFNFNYLFTNAFNSENFGILVADCGYYARDTGDNAGRGYHPGF